MAPRPACRPDEILLVSADKVYSVVKRKVVSHYSKLLKTILEAIPEAREIPLGLNSEVLAKCYVYFQQHSEHEGNNGSDQPNNINDDQKAFDAAFFKDVGSDMIMEIAKAAHYLDARSLISPTCWLIPEMIKEMSPEEMRKTLHIVNDLTPEEEEEIRQENAWVFA